MAPSPPGVAEPSRYPLQRLTFDARELMEAHPPLWRHPNKRLVFEIACPQGSTASGTLTYTRWDAMPLPNAVDVRQAAALVEAAPTVYDYADRPNPAAVHWHVNFADPHLFVAYGSALFAPDEMQVAEHPVLGSLRETLLARGQQPLTVEDDRPTPVLVTGVQRRCRINAEGIYGNAFAGSSAETIRRATTRLDPPTLANLIAMAAPAYGHGPYRLKEIGYILTTAFTGFRAAVLESARGRETEPAVVVHTGFWGCGVFGGNQIIMATLQVLAAQMAGLHCLTLHTVNLAHWPAWEKARDLLGELDTRAPMPVPALMERLVAKRLEWGVSDGN